MATGLREKVARRVSWPLALDARADRVSSEAVVPLRTSLGGAEGGGRLLISLSATPRSLRGNKQGQPLFSTPGSSV